MVKYPLLEVLRRFRLEAAGWWVLRDGLWRWYKRSESPAGAAPCPGAGLALTRLQIG